MASFNLHRNLPSCSVKKPMLENLEKYLRSEVPKILSLDDNDKVVITIVIKDDFGTTRIVSIDEYRLEKFSAKTKSIAMRLYCSRSRSEITIRFPHDDNAFADVDVYGDSCREKAIGIYNGIQDIVSDYKNYHYIINKVAPILLVAVPMGSRLGYLLAKNKVTIADVSGIFIIIILFTFIVYQLTNKIYPKVEFDTNSSIKLRTVVHWLILTLIGIFLSSYISKKFF